MAPPEIKRKFVIAHHLVHSSRPQTSADGISDGLSCQDIRVTDVLFPSVVPVRYSAVSERDLRKQTSKRPQSGCMCM